MVIKFSPLKPLFFISLCLALVWGFLFGQPSMSQTLPQAQVQITGDEISGTLNLTQRQDGVVEIQGQVRGSTAKLAPGLHGFHIHSVGVCDPNASPAYSSAGGHFDPGPFGNELPVQDNHPYHMGDLPNLEVNALGIATYSTQTSRVTITESPLTLFDGDGSAVIVHLLPDQQKAGGTAAEAGGGRIACGVVTRSL
ncbi:superoxide dismutase family protein [Chlorogloeopsis sp. ULAP01]|uniref:superoxide dismutase family protein n=1 Tax=Chlorogloeopsis sp. ULAP01 TaxID=3056483 RepID=UPI0025AAD1D0|nr:superoxide dismutase family protein [Chlorogloeopsis sp. ULAP01]MDM9385006.1 superoxide dismutase family protein [Chlorogloeopsis sp. ULAP01]